MNRIASISRRSLAAFFVASGVLLTPAVSLAAVPSPQNSTVPGCLTICPNGDLPFSVIVRDVNNSPLAGALVQIHLDNCVNTVIGFCDDCAQVVNYNPATRTIARFSDASGTATFQLCGTIFCPSGARNWAEVTADGVLLRNSTFVTTDLDGDLDVDAVDAGIVGGALGNAQPAYGDENCSGAIDVGDLQVVTAHVGHICSGHVPVAPTSWGRMKSTYR